MAQPMANDCLSPSLCMSECTFYDFYACCGCCCCCFTDSFVWVCGYFKFWFLILFLSFAFANFLSRSHRAMIICRWLCEFIHFSCLCCCRCCCCCFCCYYFLSVIVLSPSLIRCEDLLMKLYSLRVKILYTCEWVCVCVCTSVHVFLFFKSNDFSFFLVWFVVFKIWKTLTGMSIAPLAPHSYSLYHSLHLYSFSSVRTFAKP